MKNYSDFITMEQLLSQAVKKRGEEPFFLFSEGVGAGQRTLSSFAQEARSLSFGIASTKARVVCAATEDPQRIPALACAAFLADRAFFAGSPTTARLFLQSEFARENGVLWVGNAREQMPDEPYLRCVSFDDLLIAQAQPVADAPLSVPSMCGVVLYPSQSAAPRFLPWERLLPSVRSVPVEKSGARILHSFPPFSLYGILLSLLVPLSVGSAVCLPEKTDGFAASLRALSPELLYLHAAHVEAVVSAAFRTAELQAGKTDVKQAVGDFFGGGLRLLYCAGCDPASPLFPHLAAAGIDARAFSFAETGRKALPAMPLPFSLPKTPEQKQVELAVRAALPACDAFSIYASFFALGGDALSAQLLASFLGIHLQTVYAHPFLFDLAKHLHEEDLPQPELRTDVNRLLGAVPARTQPLKAGSVLLTGAYDFFGAHLLQALSAAGFHVVCIVPSKKQLAEALAFWFPDAPAFDYAPLAGDVTQPDFGLSRAAFAALKKEVSVVIHAAARTDVFGPAAQYATLNEKAVVYLCDFAENAGAAFAYISDLSVSGRGLLPRSRPGADFAEHNLLIGQALIENAYVQSRARAEAAVFAAAVKGLDATVFRIGTLGWRKSDGAFERNPENSAFLARLRAMKKLAIYEPGMERLPVELLPVDVCAADCVTLLTRGKRGKVYHLCDPKPLTVAEWFKKTRQKVHDVSPAQAQARFAALDADSDVRSYRLQLYLAQRSGNVRVHSKQTQTELRSLGVPPLKLPAAYYKLFAAFSADCLPLSAPAEEPYLVASPAQYPQAVTERIYGLRRAAFRSPALNLSEDPLAQLPVFLQKSAFFRPLVMVSADVPKENHSRIKKLLKSKEAPFVAAEEGLPSAAAAGDMQRLISAGGYDCIVAVGAENVVRLAKAAAFLYTNPAVLPSADYQYFSSAAPPFPLILAPTTAEAVLDAVCPAVYLTFSGGARCAQMICACVQPEMILADITQFSGISVLKQQNLARAVISSALESESCGIRRGFAADRCRAEKAVSALLEGGRADAEAPADAELLLRALLDAGLSVKRTGGGYFAAFTLGVTLQFGLPAEKSRRLIFAPVLRALRPYLQEALSTLYKAGKGEKTEGDRTDADPETEQFLCALRTLCGIASEGPSDALETKTEEGAALAEFVQTHIAKTASPVYLSDAAARKLAETIVHAVRSEVGM